MLQTLVVLLAISIIVIFFIWLFSSKGWGTSCGSCGSPDTPEPEKKEASPDTLQTKTPEQSKPVSMEKPEGNADDLKKISGIGPKIEQTLHELGIFHYQQIADFTNDNIDWVDNHLNFKGRIQRDNWVEQAKELAP